MTRASTKRVAKRTATKRPSKANGKSGAAGPVALTADDKDRLEKAQVPIRGLLLEKGAIDLDIEKAQDKSKQVSVAVEQKRKDFREVMRSIVVGHGLDPEVKDGRWSIDLNEDKIVFERFAQPPAKPAAAAPPAESDKDAGEPAQA